MSLLLLFNFGEVIAFSLQQDSTNLINSEFVPEKFQTKFALWRNYL